ncbi:hypothetical protein PoB_000532700 [Plakobranchus ocellatus]|uniref:Uncharacterized protein n=1 Tax=Plakobranchus ocellatus TaxID=259542 RepID=A0AAV3Y8L4_9GAST|nr:hypothetical protein PoB_000532700 [Plakobranchus ocellatus]
MQLHYDFYKTCVGGEVIYGRFPSSRSTDQWLKVEAKHLYRLKDEGGEIYVLLWLSFVPGRFSGGEQQRRKKIDRSWRIGRGLVKESRREDVPTVARNPTSMKDSSHDGFQQKAAEING